MADATVKRNDTHPPLRFACSDSDGLVDLTQADLITFLAKSGATLIAGEADPIDPPDADGYNGQYVWADGDLATAASAYSVEIEVTWDETTTPPLVETFPNKGVKTLEVEADQG